MTADRDRLEQLLENLFHNSIEHGGEVSTVRLGPLEDGFYVADDGTGIPEAERDEVFEYGFTTADSTGLGLSIVEAIARAHRRQIAATESDDGGARFEVTADETPADEAAGGVR